MGSPLRVVIMGTSLPCEERILRELDRTGQDVAAERVTNLKDLQEALRDPIDLAICHWSGKELPTVEAHAMVRARADDAVFIVVSDSSNEEEAVEAMRMGAQDFVLLQRLGRLAPIVERELRERARRRVLQADRARAEEALRQSEIQLRHAQKMEAVGRLAGGIAHEFNNALSVILSYGELILSDLEPEDPMRLDIEEIRKAAKKATDLTRQLLLFNRQHVFEVKDVDFGELLAGMDKMLRRVLGEDVALTLRVAPDLGSVRADPRSIEQALMNIVVNARDAMPNGGKVTLTATPWVVDEAIASLHPGLIPGPHVLLSVGDTGAGMSAETLARSFEPFFTTKEPGLGTGLGLSTVFGIVKQTGGIVWAESTPGAGATILMCFPCIESKGSARPSSLRDGNETVMLVEDDGQVRAVAAGILKRCGYRVLEAKSAAEADDLFRAHADTIDLLLCDVVMPDASGTELASRLSLSRPTMKLLCMSGYTDARVARPLAIPSKIAFLQKPLTPESLARKVREVLDAPALHEVLTREPK
jgi:two-component system, cell cycle sensor histidine kinase and response regulator CckA